MDWLSSLFPEWQGVTTGKLVALSLGFGLLFLGLHGNTVGYLHPIDDANLMFHEAGHPIYGLIFGSRFTVYGGTLGELTIPVLCALSFRRRGDALGWAFAWVWFFQNFIYIAAYMSDAVSQELPLVGGGEHDWTEFLSRWHVLHLDVYLGRIVRFMGWAGMGWSWGWLVRRWCLDLADRTPQVET
jgi:hypothetical protein